MKQRRRIIGIMFLSGQERMGLMDKWRCGSRRECKQFFHFNRRGGRNALAKMQVSRWKLEDVLSSVSIFCEPEHKANIWEGGGKRKCWMLKKKKKKGCKQVMWESEWENRIIGCKSPPMNSGQGFTARQSRMVIYFSPTMSNSVVRFSQGMGRELEIIKDRFLSGEYIMWEMSKILKVCTCKGVITMIGHETQTVQESKWRPRR